MATKFNLDIIRGSRYLKGFEYVDSSKNPVDLTGFSARMHIREKETSTTAELELTTDNGMLTIIPVSGQINIVLSAIDTAGLTIDTGVYDLEIYNPGDTDVVDTILEGLVTIRDAITR